MDNVTNSIIARNYEVMVQERAGVGGGGGGKLHAHVVTDASGGNGYLYPLICRREQSTCN